METKKRKAIDFWPNMIMLYCLQSYYEYSKDNRVIDEVLVSIFKRNKSYTGEETVEISCHGSSFIIKKILSITVELGARIADKGEFTFRSFLSGNIDLSQAEAVSDLISSNSENSHKMAINHIKGVFSKKIKQLRKDLSLIHI